MSRKLSTIRGADTLQTATPVLIRRNDGSESTAISGIEARDTARPARTSRQQRPWGDSPVGALERPHGPKVRRHNAPQSRRSSRGTCRPSSRPRLCPPTGAPPGGDTGQGQQRVNHQDPSKRRGSPRATSRPMDPATHHRTQQPRASGSATELSSTAVIVTSLKANADFDYSPSPPEVR